MLLDIKKSNQLLLEDIIEGGVSLTFVDSQKFKKFVYSINNTYHVPARKQLSNNILDEIYSNTNIHQDHLINFMIIEKDRQSELIKIKVIHEESQIVIVIFRDLENILL
ncbi:3541_t:CDS:2 [Cetraspora pellucida]|uniref:3541_t:CDS:1 n=1 Tax=Cetraspora pellucida TaxID=1433469 RepID=A0A9N8VZ10_9GLOM|nr:3541_t:CDS:2 [Cetraspora pellucida]